MDILNQFGINPLLLAAQVVNFFILLFILKKLLYGPILKVLDDRKKRIEESLKNAEEIERKLRETDERVDQILVKASLEGQKIIDEATAQANQIIEDAKRAAENLSQKMLEEARGRIQIERENMRWELQKDLSRLVMLIVQKVTGKMLKQRGQKELIEKTVKEFRS